MNASHLNDAYDDGEMVAPKPADRLAGCTILSASEACALYARRGDDRVTRWKNAGKEPLRFECMIEGPRENTVKGKVTVAPAKWCRFTIEPGAEVIAPRDFDEAIQPTTLHGDRRVVIGGHVALVNLSRSRPLERAPSLVDQERVRR